MQAGTIASSPLCLAALGSNRREEFPVAPLRSWGEAGVSGVSDPGLPCQPGLDRGSLSAG